jgi:hypothetical protein
MSSNDPYTINSDDNTTFIELGTADIEVLRNNFDAESSTNTKKRKARLIVSIDLWGESRDPHENKPTRNIYKQRIFYYKKYVFK